MDGPDARAFERINAMVGATVIGRRTFDLGLRPWGGTPWPGVPGFVVTHRTREDLVGDNGGTFVFDGLEAAAGDKDVLVMGTALFAGHLGELIPQGEPVAGIATHLRYRVRPAGG